MDQLTFLEVSFQSFVVFLFLLNNWNFSLYFGWLLLIA